jgi:oligo-1,6-glucosidase
LGTSDGHWWRHGVIYQIYPRSFADSNGDGIGDLGGIIDKVDHLADLGVDVVWLSPIYRSPQDDNGYDISDYQGIDPLFGDLEIFDELLAKMHDRGIKLVMDLVVNHTSDEHPWFVESRSSRDSPKRDWYWWRGPRDGMNAGDPGAEPTNWGSAFSGSAWEFDEETGEYYLHVFSKKQPDLNWENPEVREAVYAMMRWWLDRGVDGFRMDVINFISKDPELPDGALYPGHRYGLGSFINGPRIHEFMHEMHEAVFAGRDGQFLTVGEMPGVTVEHAQLFTDPARAEVDMVFQFEHVGLDHGPGGKFDVRPLRLLSLINI